MYEIGVSNTDTVIYLFNYCFEKLVLIMINFLVLIHLFASLLRSIACSQLLIGNFLPNNVLCINKIWIWKQISHNKQFSMNCFKIYIEFKKDS